MSEIRDPEKKPEKKNDRDFISEKIVRPAPSRKQVGTRMATAACAGVIFGVYIGVSFTEELFLYSGFLSKASKHEFLLINSGTISFIAATICI